MAVLCAAMPVSAYDFETDGIYYNIISMADMEVEVTYRPNGTYGGMYAGDIIVDRKSVV